MYLDLRPLAAVQSPAQTVMLTDNDGIYTKQDFVYPPQYWKLNDAANGAATSPATSPAYLYGDVLARHLETVGTLWADGHVKSHKVIALNGPATNRDELWDLN